MTTARSPLRKLQAQADRMAMILKATERGEKVDAGGSMPFERGTKESVKFAIAMDDKVLQVEMAWATIKETSEAALSAYILKHMRDEREKVH